MKEDEVLTPFFQPIIDYSARKIVAFEVLARWRRAGKWCSPAADFNLHNDVDREMLHFAEMMHKVKMMVRAHADFFAVVDYLSFNININNADQRVISCCQDFLSCGYQGRIMIELNEAQDIAADRAISQLLEKLNGMGVMLALDDFGNGYLSFITLLRFNFSVIKLDKSLILNAQQARPKAVIQHLTDLAHELGMQVVAEGVETLAVAEELRRINLSLMQGFCFGKPLSFAEVLSAFGNRMTRH